MTPLGPTCQRVQETWQWKEVTAHRVSPALGGLSFHFTSVMMKKSSPGSPCTTIFSPSSNWTGSSASATVKRSHLSKDSVDGEHRQMFNMKSTLRPLIRVLLKPGCVLFIFWKDASWQGEMSYYVRGNPKIQQRPLPLRSYCYWSYCKWTSHLTFTCKWPLNL